MPPAKKKTGKATPVKKIPTKKTGPKAISVKPGASSRRAYVNSEKELSEFLTCSRSTISRLKRKKDCPKKTADGKYPMAEWKEFYEKNKNDFSVDDNELAGERKARRELADVKLRREIFELEREQGMYMHVDEVCKIVTQAFSGTVQHLKDAEHAISPLMAGLDVPEARTVVRKNHIEALSRFSLGEWAKKKAFWSKVYAQLRDLQETFSLGNGLSDT